MSDAKIVGLEQATKTLHQLLIWLPGREQPMMLGYRKFADAEGARKRLLSPTWSGDTCTLHDDFNQVLELPARPLAAMVIDPGPALELQMELAMLQQIAQARFQAKVQSDPTLKAMSMLMGGGQMMQAPFARG